MFIRKSTLVSWTLAASLLNACGADTRTLSKKSAPKTTGNIETLEKILSIYEIADTEKSTILSLTQQLEKSIAEEDTENIEEIKAKLAKHNRNGLANDEALSLASFEFSLDYAS